MTASGESVLLITEINENIRNKGCYLLRDRRIELIFDHAPNPELRIQRLRSFAKLHHWKAKIDQLGRSVLFYIPASFSPLIS
jgi:hypothetical protein